MDSRSHFVSVGQSADDVREFGVFSEDFEAIVQWLMEKEVETVAMESTGTYRQGLYAVLQEAGFQVIPCNGKFTQTSKAVKVMYRIAGG